MTAADESSPYEICVEELDRVAQRLRRRTISAEQYEAAALEALSTYLEADHPEDDLDLLLQYARLAVEDHATDPLEGDRAALDAFDRQLQALLHEPESRAILEDMLEDLSRRLAAGDGAALDDLRSLCANGWRDHPHLFMFRDNILATLRMAFQHGAVDALVDAVLPTAPEPGPIGSPNVFGGSMQRYTLDLLATLATQGEEIGDRAVDGLVELTGHLETAGHAAVRLPMWRLGPDQRTVLLEHLEAMVELIEDDPFLVPVADAGRIPHILRSVLWLSNDAARL